jgi:hypothetical protein
MLFKDKNFDNRPDNTDQKYDNGDRINGMHYLKIKVRGPVRVFLPEKVHGTNIGS